MHIARLVAGLVVVLPFVARADKKPTPTAEVIDRLETLTSEFDSIVADAPQFAFVGTNAYEKPTTYGELLGDFPDYAGSEKGKAVVAFADPKTAWIATNLGHYGICGDGDCQHQKPFGWFHATALLEKVGATWQPVAFSATTPTTGKQQAAALKAGTLPSPIARSVATGAEDPVKLFEAALGDPKVLAATISSRKEVVLYGSELAERYVGGAQVKAQLAAWGLTFKVRDGVAAGVSRSRTVAWVAANLDASSVKRPKDKPVPYRAFVIYEKTGATWQIVQIQFSVVT